MRLEKRCHRCIDKRRKYALGRFARPVHQLVGFVRIGHRPGSVATRRLSMARQFEPFVGGALGKESGRDLDAAQRQRIAGIAQGEQVLIGEELTHRHLLVAGARHVLPPVRENVRRQVGRARTGMFSGRGTGGEQSQQRVVLHEGHLHLNVKGVAGPLHGRRGRGARLAHDTARGHCGNRFSTDYRDTAIYAYHKGHGWRNQTASGHLHRSN